MQAALHSISACAFPLPSTKDLRDVLQVKRLDEGNHDKVLNADLPSIALIYTQVAEVDIAALRAWKARLLIAMGASKNVYTPGAFAAGTFDLLFHRLRRLMFAEAQVSLAGAIAIHATTKNEPPPSLCWWPTLAVLAGPWPT
jgi:hypothetical protein